MVSRKLLSTSLVIVALVSSVTSLEAQYYLDTLFPLGLVGLNGTNGPLNSPPYGNTGLNWKWTPEESQDKNEQDLIFALGINCIGAQDAKPDYLTKVYRRAVDANVTSNILFLNH